MTITLELPADIEGQLLDEASSKGRDIQSAIVAILRNRFETSQTEHALSSLPRRHTPGIYPDEPLLEDSAYRPVPGKSAGSVKVRFIHGGRLSPAIVPDTE
jgi:hypothetical protein